MSSYRDLESRIAHFYVQEGFLRAPDRVLSSALTTIETTKQRHVLGRLFGRVSWRFPDMSNYLKVAVAAVVVIAALALASPCTRAVHLGLAERWHRLLHRHRRRLSVPIRLQSGLRCRP